MKCQNPPFYHSSPWGGVLVVSSYDCILTHYSDSSCLSDLSLSKKLKFGYEKFQYFPMRISQGESITRTKIRLSALVSPISVLIGEFCLFICLMKFDKRRGSYISITAKCFFSHLYHVADLKVVIIWTKEFCNFFSLFTFFSLPFTTWHFCKVIKWW